MYLGNDIYTNEKKIEQNPSVFPGDSQTLIEMLCVICSILRGYVKIVMVVKNT